MDKKKKVIAVVAAVSAFLIAVIPFVSELVQKILEVI